MRNYKFRLYPTQDQQKRLQNNLAVCRWVYNRFVEQAGDGLFSRDDMNYFLTELKQKEVWLDYYHSKMLQMVSTQVDAAQRALIELNKKGYKTGRLKFTKYNEYSTFTYNQSGYRLERHGNTDLLWLSKIGYIEIRKHREPIGEIKQISVTKSKSGNWYCCITCEIPIDIRNLPMIDLGNSVGIDVGIDVGIKNFAYDSEGSITPNPLNLKKMLKPLARIQRKVARRQKGSNNRKKALKFYQKIHERIANRRNEFLHKLSTQYARTNDVVFVERLSLLNLVKNHNLARDIIDSGIGTFCNMLEYKCKMAVKVNPQNTTIDCSRCGNSIPKTLAVRIHCCDKCGLVLDRDYNASINILKKGLQIFGIKLPMVHREDTPVEIQTESLKQEDAYGFGRGKYTYC